MPRAPAQYLTPGDVSIQGVGVTPDIELRASHGFVEQTRRVELGKVSADLARLGVDWTDAPDGRAPNDDVTAGEPMELRVTVTNHGNLPVYRLRGTTGSDNPYFENKELRLREDRRRPEPHGQRRAGLLRRRGRKVGSSKPVDENARRSCKRRQARGNRLRRAAAPRRRRQLRHAAHEHVARRSRAARRSLAAPVA